jgi:ABC-type amino acid transport substrate-binding protein
MTLPARPLSAVFFLLCVWCVAWAPPASAAGGALDRVRATGEVRAGWMRDATPFSDAGADGRPEGYSVALCERVVAAIGQRIGRSDLRITWVEVDLQNRFEAVAKGAVDLDCGTATRTLGRADRVDFSLSTFVDGATVLVAQSAEPFRLAELAGRRIAVIAGSTNEAALRAFSAELSAPIDLVPVRDPDTAWAQLARGDVDGFAWDRVKLLGLALAAGGSGTWRLLEEDYSLERYALVLPLDDGPWRREVDRALARVFRSGEIYAIYDRWLGPLGQPGLLLNAIWYLGRLPE